MTQDRWTLGDDELTNALRALYSAPTDERYWDALEARILAHVARADGGAAWWSEMAEMVRPGLLAAAALIFAASLALVHSRQLEMSGAYANVIAPAAGSLGATRAAAAGDGDAAIHVLLTR